MERIAIYGCGGFGREILPLARLHQARTSTSLASGIVFVSDTPSEIGTRQNGVEVISFDALITPEHRDRKVVVSLGSSTARRTLVQRCESEGLEFASLVASTHVSLDHVEVAEGAVFCDFSMCTSNIRIGRHFQCNIYSYVAHDCVVGDFVTFAPRVACNGRIVIEDDAYIGTGAVLKQGTPNTPLTIGRGAVIGMGAVVTKDVPPGVTVVGNPAAPMVKRPA
ncbi:acetyltransferase [Burkholderia ubonensis]|uniref:acetyltransferase n=1 Tax=Burkholderia ubonensis TaxID=101571 RepID=UPI0007529048|nr:acetyltransferase [Burkholderia ubonensis]KVP97593.1 acetyltransferase [Burkholderia ubonensis]KVU29378.1 acetyltransferase [Burkholderia ubonensis]KVW23789.1 acetyltransferase [Burkholderia ubonensis]KVW70358.1 acetyltransferase [Burkholderia ubonensis]KWI32248.1 acetyltransferase [Burkholderia ubonensis]